MRRVSVLLAAALLAASLPTGSALSQEILATAATGTPSAADTVAEFGDRTLRMLQDKTLSRAAREQDFRTSLEADFDLQAITHFVLGRYWETATDQERQAFSAIYKDYVVRSYSAMFDTFGIQRFKVTGERVESPATTIVRTDVIRADSTAPAKIDWRLLRSATGCKIVEVIVEGVSVSMALRQEVTSIMDRNGQQISGLIAQIHYKVIGPSTP